ncbi:sn-glycerol-1-phosphate dehydrogenase [Paenibacillus physcomitrellae]|uniref:Glycerol-1-phosphate dehydrogenase [NAD(P)+] n=1 Tax=Paenibacillus physcomitrellae TaxID=1619311 RepID=A0ABQ1FZE1_9BACL|nr:sn-glycerol-1-phosphate dehydrogenase [Paenibacillus physcomitrellae]GGA32926.1 glycerol-1-phosphate dehydrogenase [NAD(P)+] [Paenibacillus physcomitrellae]
MMIHLLDEIPLDYISLDKGSLGKLAPYVKKAGYKQPIIVADRNTYEAAGRAVEAELGSLSSAVELCMLQPDATGDCLADEKSIVQLLLAITPGVTDCLLAVGSGTIHDIVRFVSSRTGIPFLSVPTAPSVDGFTSKCAPLMIRGVKQTVTAASPKAIFADLDILTRAPQELVAAGFGNMLAKYTSLFDWKFSSLTANEPYDPRVAQITEAALLDCIAHADAIGRRTEEGIRVLMNALIESGIAMLMFGQSHPASGAEHHLSHYWEMAHLERGRKAMPHGAKVGVACAEISRLYHDAVTRAQHPGEQPAQLLQHGIQVREWLEAVPSAPEIRRLLELAGGPSTRDELGIDDELFAESLREAHKLLGRSTLLRALNGA